MNVILSCPKDVIGIKKINTPELFITTLIEKRGLINKSVNPLVIEASQVLELQEKLPVESQHFPPDAFVSFLFSAFQAIFVSA